MSFETQSQMSRVFNPRKTVGDFVTQDELEEELARYTSTVSFLTSQGLQDTEINGKYGEGDNAILGDLTVNGTTTHINSSIIDAIDETIELNSDRHAITNGGLILLKQGEGSEASVLYDVQNGFWTIGADGSNEQVARIAGGIPTSSFVKYNVVEDRLIEASAADIKTSYESNADTNAFTDADVTAIASIANKLPLSGGTMTGTIAMGANNITLSGGGLVDGVDVSARDLVLTSTTTTANNALPLAGGTMTGTIAMGANNITLTGGGLIDGVDVSARDLILTSTTATANAALPRSGGTMTGDILLGANNITLTTGLVDGVDVSARDLVLTSTTTTANAALARSGGTMTGDIVMNANNITLLGGGLVDGVDVSVRDILLGATTVTADAALSRAGGTMTGSIAMGANNITLTTGLVDGVDVSTLPGLITSAQTTADNALPKAGGTMTGTITLSGTSEIVVTGTGQIEAANGTVGAPGHAFQTSASTGLWQPAAGTLAVSAAGVEVMRSTNALTTLNLPITASGVISLSSGTAALPSIRFNAENSGLYSLGATGIGITSAGTVRATIDATGLTMSSNGKITTVNGTAAAPSIIFGAAATSGFYRVAPNDVGISVSGTSVGAWSSTGLTLPSTNRVISGDGTAAAPALSFASNTNMGFYRVGANVLGVVTQGDTLMLIDGGTIQIKPPTFRPTIDNFTSLGNASFRYAAVFAVNGTIQTSDSRMKNTISPLPATLGLSFINSLAPKTFKWNDTVNEGIPDIVHTRTHLGLIAQEVEAAIIAAGHTLQTTDIIDNDYLVNSTLADRYSIRMNSLIAPLISAIQELSARVSALEAP